MFQRTRHIVILILFFTVVCNLNTYGIKTVIIDAGHGGKDPGCINGKYKEKDIVLAVAKKLGATIKKNNPKIKVIYTRTGDTYPTLKERADIANKNHGDLFISIHVNSLPPSAKKKFPYTYGPSTYVLGLHRTEDNLKVAQQENSVILLEDNYESTYQNFDPNSIESYIIFANLQNTHLEKSMDFAAAVQDNFKQKKRKDRGVEQAGFLVLREVSMPSVLIELGFITNEKEVKYLASSKGSAAMANAIYDAFKKYYQTNTIKPTIPIYFYTIQITASKKKIPPSDLKKYPSYFYRYNEMGTEYYRYYIGKFSTMSEAKEYLEKEIKPQNKDAYIRKLKEPNE